MGIGPAFTKYGSPDAINLGPPDVPVFIVGNDRIGAGVGGGSTAPGSPVSWGADLKTIVAARLEQRVHVGEKGEPQSVEQRRAGDGPGVSCLTLQAAEGQRYWEQHRAVAAQAFELS